MPDLLNLVNFLLLCAIFVILIIPYAKAFRRKQPLIAPDVNPELFNHVKERMQDIYPPEPFKYTIPDQPQVKPQSKEVSLFEALNEIQTKPAEPITKAKDVSLSQALDELTKPTIVEKTEQPQIKPENIKTRTVKSPPGHGGKELLKSKSIVVLPAHNEEAAIIRVVTDVLIDCDSDVLVACSGCTDGTTGKVKELAIENNRVHYLDCPKGKGLAIKYAFGNIEADKTIMMDSDGTYPAYSIHQFLRALDQYQVVVGVRRMDNNNMPWGNKYSNRFVSLQARLLFGIPIRDLCCGMWGFKGNIPQEMNLRSPGFTLETEIFSYVAQHELNWWDIPIDYYPRIGERKINRLDHLKIWSAIWTRRFGQ